MKIKFRFDAISFLLLALCFSTVPMSARAGERENVILKKMTEAGIKAYASEVTKKLVDKMCNETAKDFVGKKTSAKIFATLELGQSINSYNNAHSDKDRGFAAAQAGIAALTYVNPVAGVVASLALTCVQLTDAMLAAQFSMEMANVYSEIYANYEYILKKEAILHKNDQDHLESLILFLTSSQNLQVEKTRVFTEECSNLKDSVKLSDFEKCLNLMQDQNDAQYLTLVALREIDGAVFTDESVGDLLVHQGMSHPELQNKINSLGKILEENKRKLKIERLKFAQFVSDKMLEEAKQSRAETNVETLMNSCSKQFDDYILRSSLLTLTKFRNKNMTSLTEDLKKLDLQFLVSEGDDLEASVCFQITDNDINNSGPVAQIQGEEFLNARKLFLESKEDLNKSMTSELDK